MGKQIVRCLLGTLCALAMAACTSSSDSAIPSLTISGTLGGSSLMSNKVSAMAVNDVNKSAVTLSDLEIYAIAFTSPPVIAQANVAADGSFSVDLPGAKGSAITAVFRNKASLAEVGVIKFVDSSKKDMSGNASSSSSIVLSDSVSLGNLTLAADGSVEVPVSTIAAQIGSSDSVSVATSFDPTGGWTIAAYDGTLPTGYITATAAPNQGPMIGEVISLVRLAGKDFTPGTGNCTVTNGSLSGGCAATDGTVGTSDRYALSIWGGNYASGIGACGGKIGFSADEARAFGHISVEAAGIPQTLGALDFGDYVFSTDATNFGGTGTAPYDQPWMRKTATANHPVEDCRPIKVGPSNQYNAWACKANVKTGTWESPSATGTNGWMVGIDGSGCVDSVTNKPVNVTNWGTMGFATCSTPTDVSATYGAGFTSNSCTYSDKDHDGDATTANISFVCTHIGGQFTDSSGPTTTPLALGSGEFMGKPDPIIAQGASCAVGGAGATTAQKLAGFRCYAESYWNGSSASGGCSREYNFNWQATNPDNFVIADYRGKPKNAFITNILNYSADGQMATLEDQETEKITVQTGNGSSTFCDISRRIVLNFKAVSATQLLVDLRESGRMASTNAACIAAANDAMTDAAGADGHLKGSLRDSKMIFYMNK